MISSTSSLASSTPATSANVTLFCESFSIRAFDLPNDMAFPPPAWSWRMKRKNMSPMKTIGRSVMSVLDQNGEASSFSNVTRGAGWVLSSGRRSSRSFSSASGPMVSRPELAPFTPSGPVAFTVYV